MVKRTKLPKRIWASGAVNFTDDGESSPIGPERTVNVRHQTFNVGSAGSYTTRVSYMSAVASPLKKQPNDNIAWNPPAVPAISALDEYSSMDPSYVDYVEEVTGSLPKRKRTAGVRLHLIANSFI
jgi:hypothetical protein